MTSPEDLKQLAPTGTLRGGVVTAPAASAFFAIRDGGGEVKGVTVDLIRGFAAALELPLALQVYDNSGQVTEAVAKGDCDLAFMHPALWRLCLRSRSRGWLSSASSTG